MFNILKMTVLLLIFSVNQSVFAHNGETHGEVTIDVYSEEESAKIEAIEKATENIDDDVIDNKIQENLDRFNALKWRRGTKRTRRSALEGPNEAQSKGEMPPGAAPEGNEHH